MGLLGLGCWTAWRRRSAAAGQALLVPVPLLLPLLASTVPGTAPAPPGLLVLLPAGSSLGQGDTKNHHCVSPHRTIGTAWFASSRRDPVSHEKAPT